MRTFLYVLLALVCAVSVSVNAQAPTRHQTLTHFSVSMTILPTPVKPKITQLPMTQVPYDQRPTLYQTQTTEQLKNVKVIQITY